MMNLGTTLADKGIYLSLSYIQNLLSNVSGGRQTGTLPAGELALGATFDLQKIAGITGGSLHVIFDERSGTSISRLAGTNFGLAANHGPNDVIRLSDFYYEQALFNDRIDITAGRTNPTTDFATSAIACAFVSNLICAQPGIWYTINDNGAYPLSEWGGRVNVQITPNVYVRAGGYQDDLTQIEGQGFTWRWDRGIGAFIPFELGYQTKGAKYDIGGYYDSGTYVPPTPPTLHRGRTAFYVQGQQVIWTPGGGSPRTLTAFGGALVQTGGFAPYWGEYYVGLFDTSPFLSRPEDTAGFAFAYIPLSSAVSPYSKEYIFEVNYGFTITKGVVVKPVAQYVIHPDEIGFVNPRRVSNAFIIGAQFSVDLGAALHFPQFVPH